MKFNTMHVIVVCFSAVYVGLWLGYW